MYLDKLFGLKGKVALVTGGARGIGQVVSCGLAEAGAEVVILDLLDADETISLIESKGGRAYHVKTDITDQASIDACLARVIRESGSIDILFNNAGICMHKAAIDVTAEEFGQVVNVNLTGAFNMARSVARVMIEKGIKGSIINTASMSGLIINIPQLQSSYNASKAGLIHLTKSLAVEWSEYNIRVNCISPGYISTPMTLGSAEEMKKAWIPLIPFKRMGLPEELIGAVIYLAGESSSYTTGSNLTIDGAYTCV
jgi:NAD(P)-dependent dehydrogenase (short-subunit alcohol dehydrogenase family)